MYQLNRRQGMGSFANIDQTTPVKAVGGSLVRPEPMLQNKFGIDTTGTRSTMTLRPQNANNAVLLRSREGQKSFSNSKPKPPSLNLRNVTNRKSQTRYDGPTKSSKDR